MIVRGPSFFTCSRLGDSEKASNYSLITYPYGHDIPFAIAFSPVRSVSPSILFSMQSRYLNILVRTGLPPCCLLSSRPFRSYVIEFVATACIFVELPALKFPVYSINGFLRTFIVSLCFPFSPCGWLKGQVRSVGPYLALMVLTYDFARGCPRFLYHLLYHIP